MKIVIKLDEFGTYAGEYHGRVAQGVQARVDRLKAIGNGQVPAAAAVAWRILYSRIGIK